MANMFRCTLASGGGALVLTVTCDADFAGLTITATDGTTTLTQPCPSSSPYEVEFKIPNAGQWTISGVISGETQSITVDIPDNVVLRYVPNGSTVTPTDDIQIWLHCAEIWDKGYTTISQVLNDASTLQALIASNNAADYMARSTTWASSVVSDSSAMTYIGLNDYCSDTLLADSTWLSAICNSTYFESVLNVKVPTMTSATTPSGEVISTANWSQNPAYQAFDNNMSTQGTMANAEVGSNVATYIGYIFTSNVAVKKAIIRTSVGSSHTNNGYIQYRDNNSNWQNATSQLAWSNGETTPFECVISSAAASEGWRVYQTYCSNGSTRRGFYEIQFYGRASS